MGSAGRVSPNLRNQASTTSQPAPAARNSRTTPAMSEGMAGGTASVPSRSHRAARPWPLRVRTAGTPG